MAFLDVLDRAYKGPMVDKHTWDITYVVKACRKICKEFDLKYPAGEVVCRDEDLIRRFYEAGRQLVLRSGIYHQDTERIITFSEKEIDDAAAAMNHDVVTGRGKDGFVFYPRKPEDTRKPGVVAGNPGCPMTEQEFRWTVESWAKEPAIDMVTCGSIAEVDGKPVRGREPIELLAVRRELAYLNEICEKVGRPGIGRLAAESSVSEIGDLGAMGANGIREGDAHLICFNNELITNNDNLIRAASTINTDILNATLACVMVGGLAGGPAGATVCMIASMLASNVLYQADYHLCHPIHMTKIATTMKECMWLQSVTNQAFSLCAPCVIINDIYPKSGAGTKELLREVAANALAITVSGGHVEGVGAVDGLKANCSGLEDRLMGRVAAEVARIGLTRKDAAEIIEKLFDGYKAVMDGRNDGQHFNEVYDVDRMEPTPQWQAQYDEVAEELRSYGLDIT